MGGRRWNELAQKTSGFRLHLAAPAATLFRFNLSSVLEVADTIAVLQMETKTATRKDCFNAVEAMDSTVILIPGAARLARKIQRVVLSPINIAVGISTASGRSVRQRLKGVVAVKTFFGLLKLKADPLFCDQIATYE